jgi:plasmid stabilization system protein ParE
MSIPEVSFNRLAVKDYREARDWYSARSADAGKRFVDAVDAAVRRICAAPESLPVISGKYRRVPLENFPHSLIFYQRTEFEVRIVAVAHPSRQTGLAEERVAGYWQVDTISEQGI